MSLHTDYGTEAKQQTESSNEGLVSGIFGAK